MCRISVQRLIILYAESGFLMHKKQEKIMQANQLGYAIVDHRSLLLPALLISAYL